MFFLTAIYRQYKVKETEDTRLLFLAPKREERKEDRRDENGNDTLKGATAAGR